MPFCVQDFVRHYLHFMEQSRDFDQRLATVLNQAFQDSKNLNSTFKVCIFMETICYKKATTDVFLSSPARNKEQI